MEQNGKESVGLVPYTVRHHSQLRKYRGPVKGFCGCGQQMEECLVARQMLGGFDLWLIA